MTTPKELLARYTTQAQLSSLYIDKYGVISVKSYGALGDGTTDDTTAIDAAIALNLPLYFPSGTYLYDGKISIGAVSNLIWKGAGSGLTTIKFTDSTVSALVERLNRQTAIMHIEGITFQGPGKTAGSSIKGFYSDYAGTSVSYNLRMVDVAVTNVSGNGFEVTDWFQQTWMGCYVREIGGDGFIIDGDQSPTFIGTGSYNNNVTGYSWWFQSGSPLLTNLNTGPCGSGIKFGRPSSHARGASYCKPSIFGLNIEGVDTAGGSGLYFYNGSNIVISNGIQVYAYGAIAVLYGCYFEYLADAGFMAEPITFTATDAGSSFTNYVFIAGAAAGGFVFQVGAGTAVTGTNATSLINVKGVSGQLSTNNLVKLTEGFTLDGRSYDIRHRTITASENIRRDSGVLNDSVLLVDATSGAVTVSLDYGTYMPGRVLTIKKIDASVNAVIVDPLTNIDGAASYSLTTQWQTVTVVASVTTNDWHKIGTA